jgi:hypothetical protein
MSDLNDANFWHQRAKDARGIAEAMTLPAAQREMLAIAEPPTQRRIQRVHGWLLGR